MARDDLWTAMPFIDAWPMTELAARDVLAQQGVRCRLVLIDQGSSDETRAMLDRFCMQHPEVLSWSYNPRLPLSAVWNLFMRFVSSVEDNGVGWIVNNDVRLHPEMAAALVDTLHRRRAWFVSGGGVGDGAIAAPAVAETDFGGPDFSCFVYAVEGWEQFPFDERFPVYCEDLDLHRRLLLAGHGQRIFGVNAPFVHFASGTLKQSDAHRQRVGQVAAQSRRYYAEKWGGAENQERYAVPFDVTSAQDGMTTPELLERARQQQDPHFR